MCTARCETVKPIRQWQTEEHYRALEKSRQASSSQRRVCDLSIHGEAIATSSRPKSTVSSPSGYNRITAEMDIDTVHQACTPTAAAVTRARTRGSKPADVRGPCCRLSPECRTQRNPWDFDPFLQDDTGRMISTKTPVAKMTAPLSMVKVRSAVAGKQHAGKSDENNSTGKSKPGKKVTAGKQHASRLSKANSSDKSATPVTKVATRASVSKEHSVDAASELDRNNSLKKLKNGNAVADEGDENNSSNKWKTTTATSAIITSVVKDGEGKRRASKSENKNSSNQEKDDGDEKEDELNLLDTEKERLESRTLLQPAERRRRSPSLQVRF